MAMKYFMSFFCFSVSTGVQQGSIHGESKQSQSRKAIIRMLGKEHFRFTIIPSSKSSFFRRAHKDFHVFLARSVGCDIKFYFLSSNYPRRRNARKTIKLSLSAQPESTLTSELNDIDWRVWAFQCHKQKPLNFMCTINCQLWSVGMTSIGCSKIPGKSFYYKRKSFVALKICFHSDLFPSPTTKKRLNFNCYRQ